MKPVQVEFAHALVDAQLLTPARRLKQLAASGGEEANKERLKGLLMQVGAVCASAQFCERAVVLVGIVCFAFSRRCDFASFQRALHCS